MPSYKIYETTNHLPYYTYKSDILKFRCKYRRCNLDNLDVNTVNTDHLKRSWHPEYAVAYCS